MDRNQYYSIGEVAATCNTSIKTLRYYDEIKLVVPEIRKAESKYRYYSKDQMVTISIIRKLRMLGFSIKEIKEIVSADQVQNLEQKIEDKLVCIKKEIENLNQKYFEGEQFLQRLKEGAQILHLYDDELKKIQAGELEAISVKEVPEVNLYHSRKIMQSYHNDEVSLERWVEINDEVSRHGLKVCGPITVTYYTELLDQFLSKDCDIEFGIQVEESSSQHVRKFGGFRAATAFHVGPYSDVIKTHIKIIQWINQNHYKIAGPVSEEFIISPVDLRNENEHVTKIIIPVTRA